MSKVSHFTPVLEAEPLCREAEQQGIGLVVTKEALVIDAASFSNKPAMVRELIAQASEHGFVTTPLELCDDRTMSELRGNLYRLNGSEGFEFVDERQSQKQLRKIIEYAVSNGAQDIHIREEGEVATILLKINGELSFSKPAPLREPRQSVQSAITMAISWEASDEQDADENSSLKSSVHDYKIVVGGRETRTSFRIQRDRLGADGEGWMTTVRILNSHVRSLEQLNVSPQHIEKLTELVARPQGMIIFSGPTGSGKSSLIHGVLAKKPPSRKCITVEDPVEIRSEDPSIYQQTLQRGKTFHEMLDTHLRHDPEMIVLGEMRDEQTTDVAYRMALSGQLFMTTLHANDSLGCFERLRVLGLSSAKLASPGVINALIAVRLVRQLCPHCRLPESYVGKTLYRRSLAGCQHCNESGIAGRLPLIEIIEIEPDYLPFIRNEDEQGLRQVLRQSGRFISLAEQAAQAVLDGRICRLDAAEVIEGIEAALDVMLAEKESVDVVTA